MWITLWITLIIYKVFHIILVDELLCGMDKTNNLENSDNPSFFPQFFHTVFHSKKPCVFCLKMGFQQFPQVLLLLLL